MGHRYEITEQEDGKWLVQAFDAQNAPLGQKVFVNTRTDAYKIFMLLTGEPDPCPEISFEDTQEIDLSKFGGVA
jgi:hypothetical protein